MSKLPSLFVAPVTAGPLLGSPTPRCQCSVCGPAGWKQHSVLVLTATQCVDVGCSVVFCQWFWQGQGSQGRSHVRVLPCGRCNMNERVWFIMAMVLACHGVTLTQAYSIVLGQHQCSLLRSWGGQWSLCLDVCCSTCTFLCQVAAPDPLYRA
jgi:hypothetical protein